MPEFKGEEFKFPDEIDENKGQNQSEEIEIEKIGRAHV